MCVCVCVCVCVRVCARARSTVCVCKYMLYYDYIVTSIFVKPFLVMIYRFSYLFCKCVDAYIKLFILLSNVSTPEFIYSIMHFSTQTYTQTHTYIYARLCLYIYIYIYMESEHVQY